MHSLHIDQNVSPSSNKVFFFFLSICVGGHSLSHESSFFIYHHTACFLGLQRYSPRASLRTDTMWRHCRKICSLKIGPSINGDRDARLRFSHRFLKIPFKRTRDTLTCQQEGICFTSNLRPVCAALPARVVMLGMKFLS